MKKIIRKFLVKLIGLKLYLKLVSKVYLLLIRWGFLHKQYPELLFLYKIVDKNDNVIDIGANLGYYSKQLKRILSKGNGCLLAIEPIPLFASIWKVNVGEAKNIKLENYALGNENKCVKMAIPIVDGVVRHGLTKVLDETSSTKSIREFNVDMKIADEVVFSKMNQKIDFIKCDVEGYEQHVIPNLIKTILHYKPVFQIELAGKQNRTNVVNFMMSHEYEIFILNKQKLNPVSQNKIHSVSQDFYFIHNSKIQKFKNLIHE